MLLNLMQKLSIRKMQYIAFTLMLLYVVFPLVMMLFNLFNLNPDVAYNCWYTVTYFAGISGVLFGVFFLKFTFAKSSLSFLNLIKSFFPLVLLLLFGVWILICDLHAKFKFIAFGCYGGMQNGFFMCVAYFGFVLLGIVVCTNEIVRGNLIKVFLTVGIIQAIVALLNNDMTMRLCRNSHTTSYGYESVFYNSNHYAYYLIFCIFGSAFLMMHYKKYSKKAGALAIYILFILVLVLNNTFGVHLAIFLTLLILVGWSFINREAFEKDKIILLLLFVCVSLVTIIFVPNVLENYSNLLYSIKTLFVGGEASNSVGSGRGLLWKYAIGIAKANPVFGTGSQNYLRNAHNIFLDIAASYGFVGLGIYLSFLSIGIIRLFKNRKSQLQFAEDTAFIIIAYLISAFFGVTVFYTAPYFYFVLGVCLMGGTTNNYDSLVADLLLTSEKGHEKIDSNMM